MCAGEGEVDDFLSNTEGFEDLSSLIRVENRDSHLRHDFEKAFFKGLAVVGHRLFRRDALQLSFDVMGDDVSDCCVSEIRADGGCAESEETGDLMGVTGFAGIDDDGATKTLAATV